MRVTKEFDTVEEYRGRKGWVNKKIGIAVYLTCKDETEFYGTIEKLENEGLELDVAGCPAEETGEYGKKYYTDVIGYFDIQDKEDADHFIRECKSIIKR